MQIASLRLARTNTGQQRPCRGLVRTLLEFSPRTGYGGCIEKLADSRNLNVCSGVETVAKSRRDLFKYALSDVYSAENDLVLARTQGGEDIVKML
jgi:hypothetical protein